MAELVGYFGYGSLVNKDTLRTDYVDHLPVRLTGWRRHWEPRHTDVTPPIALLSVHKEPASSILGMLVVDRVENLVAVDEREEGYDRVSLDPRSLELMASSEKAPLPDQLYVYVARKCVDEGDTAASRQSLLQSYTDAVLQGFYREFGTAGVAHFAETTIGFERKLNTDRAKPLYPRAVALSLDEQALFDKTLQNAGVI